MTNGAGSVDNVCNGDGSGSSGGSTVVSKVSRGA